MRGSVLPKIKDSTMKERDKRPRKQVRGDRNANHPASDLLAHISEVTLPHPLVLTQSAAS